MPKRCRDNPAPTTDVLAVMPVPPWAASGAQGTQLTRHHLDQLSTKIVVTGTGGATDKIWRTKLTDEIVNAYAELMQLRHRSAGGPRTLFLNSFFVERLGGVGDRPYCFEHVRRWFTPRKLMARCGVESVLALDRILVPANVEHAEGRHWLLLEVLPVRRSIQCFDSADGGQMTEVNLQVLRSLRHWLADESARRLAAAGTSIASELAQASALQPPPAPAPPSSEWDLARGDCPQRQDYAGDCGVYMLTNARLLAAGKPLEYSEADMPMLRRGIAHVLRSADSRTTITTAAATTDAAATGRSGGHREDDQRLSRVPRVR
jgi:hypothetical protein